MRSLVSLSCLGTDLPSAHTLVELSRTKSTPGTDCVRNVGEGVNSWTRLAIWRRASCRQRFAFASADLLKEPQEKIGRQRSEIGSQRPGARASADRTSISDRLYPYM